MYGNGGILGGSTPTRTGALGIWTVAEIACAKAKHDWPTVKDPSFSSVPALYHFDGADGTAAFENAGSLQDSLQSTSQSSGNIAALSSAQSVFGGAALASNATGYARNGSIGLAGLAFGTADYTVEFFVRLSSVSAAQNLFDMRPNGTNGAFVLIDITASASIGLWANSAYRINSANGAIASNVWTHVALSRVSGTTRLYVDGAQVGADFADSINYGNACIACLSGGGGTNKAVGYMDELRITKGVGRYSSGFSVPVEPFPDY